MGTGCMTGYLAQQCIKHLPTHNTAIHAAVNRILVRMKHIYIYVVDVVVVVVKIMVFVIIVLARSSGHRTRRPTTKNILTLQEQIVHLTQEYRIFYNPENRLCDLLAMNSL